VPHGSRTGARRTVIVSNREEGEAGRDVTSPAAQPGSRERGGRFMRHSTDRILVSHAGNLPRPSSLDELIEGGRNTSSANQEEYHRRLPEAVKYIVDRQIEHGVDVV